MKNTGRCETDLTVRAQVSCGLVWLPYKMLIECTMVLIALSTMLFLWAVGRPWQWHIRNWLVGWLVGGHAPLALPIVHRLRAVVLCARGVFSGPKRHAPGAGVHGNGI
jgi:hypothetical protein